MIIEILLAVIAFNTLAISYSLARVVVEMREHNNHMT